MASSVHLPGTTWRSVCHSLTLGQQETVGYCGSQEWYGFLNQPCAHASAPLDTGSSQRTASPLPPGSVKPESLRCRAGGSVLKLQSANICPARIAEPVHPHFSPSTNAHEKIRRIDCIKSTFRRRCCSRAILVLQRGRNATQKPLKCEAGYASTHASGNDAVVSPNDHPGIMRSHNLRADTPEKVPPMRH